MHYASRPLLLLCLAAVAASLPAVAARAQAPVAGQAVIGVAAPLDGATALLGRQILAGAEEAVADAAPAGSARLVSADTGCSAEGGAAAARQLLAGGARIVVGFLCAEALEAALPILGEAEVPTLAVGVRADRVTDERARRGALVWRIGPRSDAEAAALLAAIRALWADAPFGLVDDGSSEARALADALRAALETEGRPPAVLDTLRPGAQSQTSLVGRLAASGASRFVVVAPPGDAAILARDAAAAGTPVSLLGGESFFDEPSGGEAPSLPDGTLAVAPRDFYPLDDPAQPGADVDPSGSGYRRLAAVATEIALAALAAPGGDPAARLGAGPFETRRGPVAFDAEGDSSLDHFAVLEWRGGRFTPAEEPTQ